MRKYLLLAAAAVMALPVSASALDVSKTERSENDTEIFGMPIDSLSAGGGYSNWTGQAAPDIAPGLSWDVRMDLDASQPVELEVGYLGAYNSFTPDEISGNAIYTNEALLAAQIQPWSVGDVEPYVSGGLGIARASVAKDPEVNATFQSDTMGAIPLAAGAEYDITDSLQLGARAQWDMYFDTEILTTEEGSSDRWGILVNLGSTNF